MEKLKTIFVLLIAISLTVASVPAFNVKLTFSQKSEANKTVSSNEYKNPKDYEKRLLDILRDEKLRQSEPEKVVEAIIKLGDIRSATAIGDLVKLLDFKRTFPSGFEKTSDSEKCSSEIENLKLCVENPKVVVNSGEQVRIKLFWVNTSDSDRRIGRSSTGYSVKVTDKNGKKLIPVFEQRFIERQERIRKSGEEDKGVILRTFSGSNRGLYAEANGIEKDEIRLTDKMYDYVLTSKGIYHLTISKKVASLDKEKTIEFVLNDIEIQVN